MVPTPSVVLEQIMMPEPEYIQILDADDLVIENLTDQMIGSAGDLRSDR